MAMVGVDDRRQQPTDRLTAQVGWFALRVGSHLVLFDRVNTRNDFIMMTAL